MTIRPRLAPLSLLIGFSLLKLAHATNHTWIGSQNPDWNAKENWLDGIPDTSTELAVFNGSGSQNAVIFAADIDSSSTASGMGGILVQRGQTSALSIHNSGQAGVVFRLATSAGIAIEPNAGAFSMDTDTTGSAFFLSLTGVDTTSIFQNDSANTATLGNKITIQNRSSQSPTLQFSGSGNWLVDSLITGALPIVKDGAGTLTLSNLNSYTGGTTVKQGILSLTAVAADAGRIRGTLNIETGGEVQSNQWGFGNSNISAARNVTTININGGILNKIDDANNGGIHGATINMKGGEIKGNSCVISNIAGGAHL